MAAILQCPICNVMLKEDGDEMKVHENTYSVYDVHGPGYNGWVGDDFTRTIKCNHCGFTGSTEDFPD